MHHMLMSRPATHERGDFTVETHGPFAHCEETMKRLMEFARANNNHPREWIIVEIVSHLEA